jgi:hypothetical protein
VADEDSIKSPLYHGVSRWRFQFVGVGCGSSSGIS